MRAIAKKIIQRFLGAIMLTNIKLVMEACKQLKIDGEMINSNQNVFRVKLLDKYYYFVNFSTPFNSESVAQLFRDKEYTYEVLKNKVKIPRTQGFLSPFCEEKYHKYLKFNTIEAIATEIIKNFSIPAIVKRNRGSAGNNVFLCKHENDIKTALEQIFNIASKDYDYMGIAQEYIEIKHEYRAIFWKNKLVLLYEKNISEATFIGNLSPLHWEGAKAKHIIDSNLISRLEKFVQPIFEKVSINYAGLDLASDKNGQDWLIEVNSKPNYDIFIRDNDPQLIVNVFKHILQDLRDLQNC